MAVFLGDELCQGGIPIENVSAVARHVKAKLGSNVSVIIELAIPLHPLLCSFNPSFFRPLNMLRARLYMQVHLNEGATPWWSKKYSGSIWANDGSAPGSSKLPPDIDVISLDSYGYDGRWQGQLWNESEYVRHVRTHAICRDF